MSLPIAPVRFPGNSNFETQLPFGKMGGHHKTIAQSPFQISISPANLLERLKSLCLLGNLDEAQRLDFIRFFNEQFPGSTSAPFFQSGKNFQPTGIEKLTETEKRLLEYLSKGWLYKEIASEMRISLPMVKQHCHKIYGKIGVQNRTEAVNWFFGR